MQDLAAQDEHQVELSQEQQLLLDDNPIPPTSMACSQCYSPYDLEDRTPYNLNCDHSACKQCLRRSHKSKLPYVCPHDSVVVPLQVIKTLSKNIEVIKILRNRNQREKEKIEQMKKRGADTNNNTQGEVGSKDVSRSADETINKLKQGSQYIDVSAREDSYIKPNPHSKSLSPAHSTSKKESRTSLNQKNLLAVVDQDQVPDYPQGSSNQLPQYRKSQINPTPINLIDEEPKRTASNYFPGAGGSLDRPSSSQIQMPGARFRGSVKDSVYNPPQLGGGGPSRKHSTNQIENLTTQNPPNEEYPYETSNAQLLDRKDSAQALMAAHSNSLNKPQTLATLGLLQTPLREITEEPSGDLTTNTSIMMGGKKKKKKKKRRSDDMSYSYAAEDDEGQGGGSYDEEQKFVVNEPKQMKSQEGLNFNSNDGYNKGINGQNQLNVPAGDILRSHSNSNVPPSPLHERAPSNFTFPTQLSLKPPSSQDITAQQNSIGISQQLQNQQEDITPTRSLQPHQLMQQLSQGQQPNQSQQQDELLNNYGSPIHQKTPNALSGQYATPSQYIGQDQIMQQKSQNFQGIPNNFGTQVPISQSNEEIKHPDQLQTMEGHPKIPTERAQFESMVGNTSILNRRYEESEPPSRVGSAAGGLQFYNNLAQNQLSKSLPPKVNQDSASSPMSSPQMFQGNNPKMMTERSMGSTGDNFMQPFMIQQNHPSPLKPLPVPFVDQCASHPHEQVKYYCRNAECMSGLCWVCILQHSRHDFVAADDNAALEVKSIIRQAQRMCKKQASHLKSIKILTDNKLQFLNSKRDEEFGRLNQWFSQLRRMLDEREIFLRASFNVEIKEVENRLQQDVKLIHDEHQQYVTIFRELKFLGERFSLSSDKGIVSNARLAWELSQKTNSHINSVWEREKNLYVIQQSQIREQQDQEFQVGDDAHRDLKLPKFKIDFEKEKQKLELVGEIVLYNQNPDVINDELFNMYGDANPLFQVPEYNQIQLEEFLRLQQDLKPLPPLSASNMSAYSQQQKNQMIPLLEKELQALLAQSDDIYSQANQSMYQQQLQGVYDQIKNNTKNIAQNNSINIPLPDPKNAGQELGIQVSRDEHNQLTIKVLDSKPKYDLTLPIPDSLPGQSENNQQQNQYPYQPMIDPLQNSMGKKSLQTNLPPVLEEFEEATPLEVTPQEIIVAGSQRANRKSLNTGNVGAISKRGPMISQGIQTQTENKGMQTKFKKTADQPIQCEAETRNVKIQTKKQPLPQVKDLRSLTTQTPAPPIKLNQEVQISPPPIIPIEKVDFESQFEQPPIEVIKEVIVYKEPIKNPQSSALIQTSKSLRRVSEFPELATQTSVPQSSVKKKIDDEMMQTESVHGNEIQLQTSSIGLNRKPSQFDLNTQTTQVISNVIQTQTTPKPALDAAQTQTSAISLSRQNSKSQGAGLPPMIKQKPQKKSDTAVGVQVGDMDQFRLHTIPLRNIHWFRWNTNELYRLNAESKNWELRDDLSINQRFLFFANILHLPNDQGCFLMGGTDNENNYSRRVQYFVKYNLLLEKPPMISKRAFFSSVFVKLENSLFVFGGSDSDSSDLAACEKFSLIESVWRPIAPLKIPRNGTCSVIFENYRLIFIFGGNNHKTQGSLLSIEKYAIDFDKWEVIDIQLRRAIHDMQAMQATKDRVLIFGGHTDTDGPNKDVQLLDLSQDCYKSKYGNQLSLPDASDGGKTYFPPMYDPVTNKLYLIFGYCDEAPFMEDLNFGDFVDFHRIPRTLGSNSVRNTAAGSQNGGDSYRKQRSSLTVLDVSLAPDKDLSRLPDLPISGIPTPTPINNQDIRSSFSGYAVSSQKPRSKSNNPNVNALIERHNEKQQSIQISASQSQLKGIGKVPKLKL